MNRRIISLVAVLIITAAGCGDADRTLAPGPQPQAPAPTVAETDSGEMSLLPHPYTVEQIREQMVVGLRVMIRHTTPDGSNIELWNVVDADKDSVEIEYSELDDTQEVLGETKRQRASWIELRDHASFPAERSSRVRVTMDTDLGILEGWLYTVEGDDPGVVNEFFFADTLPGAPVVMRTLQNGEEVFSMKQFVRMRPVDSRGNGSL